MKNNLIKSRPAILFLPTFVLLLITAIANANDKNNDAELLLTTILREDKYVSYKASEIVTLFSGKKQELFIYKVGQQKPDKLRIEKQTLDGKIKKIMVHDNKFQIEYYPDENLVIKRRRIKKKNSHKQVYDHLSLVKKNYDVSIVGNTNISNRKCDLISITPKEVGSRPRFRACMDREMLLPLKRETYSSSGNITYMSTFTDISFNPSFGKDYFVIMVPRFTTAYEMEEPVLDSTEQFLQISDDGAPNKVPGGYLLREVKKDRSGTSQFIYYDGLNRISAFMENWYGGKNGQGNYLGQSKEHKIETITANGFKGFFCDRGTEKILSFITNDKKYTVVGEVSKEGLINVASEINMRSLKR